MTTLTMNSRQMQIMIVVLSLAAFSAQSRSQTTNLLQDPGFEASSSLAPYWYADGALTASGVDTNAAHAHSGNNAGYIYDDYGSGKFIDLSQTVKVAANTTYTLTGYVDASNTTGGVMGVRTTGGTNIGTTPLVNTDPGPFTHGGSDYQPYTVKFSSGSNTKVVVFAGYTTPGSGSFINIDDVSLVLASGQTPPPADPPSGQTVINYPNGFGSGCCGGGSDSIWLQNATVMSGSAIQLTALGTHEGNNAWFKTPVNVQNFTTTFTFNMNCGGDVSTCANGMGFMIISDPNNTPAGFTYSGFSGNQFSWSQCTFTPYTCVDIKSIIVKFDLFSVLTNTGGSNFTGLCSGGTYCEPPYNTQYDMSGSGINMQSGHLFKCTLSYNGSALTQTLTDTVSGAQYTHSYNVNIPSLVGGTTAFVGFGGGTGDTDNVTQDVDSWTYTVQ